ncbi:MAG: mammalian cell entry protein, partial [Burkholderiales bacterium]
TNDQRRALIDKMIARGLRAQLRSGNLLTGQLIVALDFFPAAPKAGLHPSVKLAADSLPEIPTMPSSLVEIQETIASIAAKVKTIPIDEVAADLRQTLRSANHMLERVDAEIMPDARATLVDARKAMSAVEQALKPESPLSQDAREAMRELARAAAAFRALSDYLERHPEAMISGKREDPKEDNK